MSEFSKLCGVVAATLRDSHKISAAVWEENGPVTCVQVDTAGFSYLFGAANTTWGGDLYHVGNIDLEPIDNVQTAVSSTVDNASVIAESIAAAVAQHETDIKKLDTPEFIGSVALALKAHHDIDAELIHTGGGIYCVEVKKDGLLYTFGSSCETWGADVGTIENESSLLPVFTAISSNSIDAGKIADAIADSLNPKTIAQLFSRYFEAPLERDFSDLPIASVCGEACKKAIDGAVVLMDGVNNLPPHEAAIYNAQIRTILVHVLEVYYFG